MLCILGMQVTFVGYANGGGVKRGEYGVWGADRGRGGV